jgi:hypothetical protein
MLSRWKVGRALRITAAALVVAALVGSVGDVRAAGRIVEVEYPAASAADGLQLAVTYRLWLPDTTARLRGVIVHQHGCGTAANNAGLTAAADLHWQALATKWNCALLGPSYRQTEGGVDNCRLWCDPRNGSHAAFKQALVDLAAKCDRPELPLVPWCLWGHSGGGFWVSLMQTLEPERIVAAWLRSGTAFGYWASGELEAPSVTAATLQIPTMLNPGIKESVDGRPHAAWLGSVAMFKDYRARGAAIGFAADPLSGHDCGDSRYLAIPYFDACLAQRLPPADEPDAPLRPVSVDRGWLGELMGRKTYPPGTLRGKAAAAGVWLPDEATARLWIEYVSTGATGDSTPPAAPFDVRIVSMGEHGIELAWDAAADFESGLRAFVIERDGRRLDQVPSEPVGKFGRPLFQTMSFHDTPEAPPPAMRFLDIGASATERHTYRVLAVNGVGLESPPSAAVSTTAAP